jgi:hypothetical protein
VDGFVVRRARVKATANPTDKTRVVVSLDLGKNTTVVKDAFFQYIPSGTESIGPSFYIGQQNWPFGYDLPTADDVRETPERALIGRLFFPNERDTGAKITGPTDKKIFWQIGGFNGVGTQVGSGTPQDDNVYVMANLKYNIVPDLYLGVSSATGTGAWKSFSSTTWTPGVDRDRYGADMQYYGHNFTLKGEYETGRGVDNAASTWNQKNDVNGYWAQLAINLTRTNELVGRYSTVSVDPVAPQYDRLRAWDIGFIHWLDNNAKVKLFYQINEYETNPIRNNGFVTEFMVSY